MCVDQTNASLIHHLSDAATPRRGSGKREEPRMNGYGSPRSDSSSFPLHLNTHRHTEITHAARRTSHKHAQQQQQHTTPAYLGSVLEREGAPLRELHEVVVHQHLPHALRHGRQLPAQPARKSAPRESLSWRTRRSGDKLSRDRKGPTTQELHMHNEERFSLRVETVRAGDRQYRHKHTPALAKRQHQHAL